MKKHERERYNWTSKDEQNSANSHIKLSTGEGNLMIIDCTENRNTF